MLKQKKKDPLNVPDLGLKLSRSVDACCKAPEEEMEKILNESFDVLKFLM